ncbi:MAG: putative toxin-antitoxin system toxin component, PIN family [Phycisphaerales bacterium]
MLRVVLDTNVIVTALRSRRGAAYRLLQLVGTRKFEHVLSVGLCFEYEAALKRPEVGIALSSETIDDILDYLCNAALRYEIHFLWRPTLPDPGDDLVLELAVRASCDAIVTYNLSDFVGIDRFGLVAMSPAAFLRKIGSLP